MKRRSWGAVQLFALLTAIGVGGTWVGVPGSAAAEGTGSGRRSTGPGAGAVIGRGATAGLGCTAVRAVGEASTDVGGAAGLPEVPGAAASERGRPGWWGRP